MSTRDYELLINGQLVSADETFDVINPASEAVVFSSRAGIEALMGRSASGRVVRQKSKHVRGTKGGSQLG